MNCWITNLDISIQVFRSWELNLERETHRSGMIVYAKKNVRLDIVSTSSRFSIFKLQTPGRQDEWDGNAVNGRRTCSDVHHGQSRPS